MDVGCGTGQIAAEIASRGVAVTGVDIDADALTKAATDYPDIDFKRVKKDLLPFKNNSFDLVFCHFVLMWQARPARLVAEMARVAKPGGFVVAAAEPDYAGRIAFPDDGLKTPLSEALASQGADVNLGIRLRSLFVSAGLYTEVGVWPSLVSSPAKSEEFDSEWALYAHVLKGVLNPDVIAKEKSAARDLDLQGKRAVFLPIFYAVGKKPT